MKRRTIAVTIVAAAVTIPCAAAAQSLPTQGTPTYYGSLWEDFSTQEYGMHSCPVVNGSQSLMIGARIDSNAWLCGKYNYNLPTSLGSIYVDTTTERDPGDGWYYKGCPYGYVMAGFSQNPTPSGSMVCQPIWPTITDSTGTYYWHEYVDTGTQMSGMHACGVGAMVGIRVDLNRFLCGYYQ